MKTPEDYARKILGYGCLCECVKHDAERSGKKPDDVVCEACQAKVVIQEIQDDVRKDIEEKLRTWRTQYDPGKENLDKYAQTVIDSAIKFVRGTGEFA